MDEKRFVYVGWGVPKKGGYYETLITKVIVKASHDFSSWQNRRLYEKRIYPPVICSSVSISSWYHP